MKQTKCQEVNHSILTLTLCQSPTGNNNLSPVIDTKKMSLFLIQNRLNNPISGTTPDFVEETTNTGGSAAAKYITKPVILENHFNIIRYSIVC